MTKHKLKKILLSIFGVFAIFTIVFYFLVGDQIRYKDSNKNVKMLDADTVSIELVDGVVLEQEFTNELEQLESVAVVGHTFWRNTNEGTLTIELIHNDTVLLHQDYDVNEIPDQHRTYLDIDKPLENLVGEKLTLKIYADSEVESGICLMSTSNNANGNLYINGELTKGSICFTTTGKQKILFGEYYWPAMICMNAIIAAILFLSYKKYEKGSINYLISIIFAIDRYEFLISQLVSRDFKSKYKRSVLGILWSFLNPLLTMTVQFLVFSTIFRTDTKVYPVYLLIGVICFNFFNEVTTMCLTSITGNERLINKVYIPKYIFPLSKTISASINLGISLIPLTLVCIIMGIGFHKSVFLIFVFLICLLLFSLGVGMFLSTLMVFFRDVQFLWTVVCQIWMYATPIFYPAEIIPAKYKFIVQINPLYHFIGNARKCIIDGISPEPIAYIYCIIFALVSFSVGTYVFKKSQDKFTLYL